MDYGLRLSLGGPMDDLHRDLIVRLCTEAGIRMENASLMALTIRSKSPQATQEILDELCAKARETVALLQAARALCE